MDFLGLTSNRIYRRGKLVASAGEGSVHGVEGDNSLLLKILSRPLTPRQLEKLKILAAFRPKPDHAAIPIEIVVDLVTQTPVGFVLPFYSNTVPLTRVLDSHGRKTLKLPDGLAFRVKLCRLLAEAFARIHAANLVIGDVSDGNFLLGRDRFGRVTVVYVIDCNSFQIVIRTNRGNECFPSGVATEEYAAPEVQSTDWATSLRSIYSDSFGFAILAWKLIFDGSHPFAVITPRSVDVPPLGNRIEKRLFPFRPGTLMPANWKAPAIQPSLAVLPVELRELFFQTFSSADPRDRATSDDWCHAFRTWEYDLTPSIPFRFLGVWNGSLAIRLSGMLSRFKPYLGRAIVFILLVALTALTTQLDFNRQANPIASEPTAQRVLSDFPRKQSNRPRLVDRELFPELVRPNRTKKPE